MVKTKKSFKKSIKVQIAERMKTAFADMLAPLGKTKFQRNIKKAAKALTEDFKGFDATVSEKKKNVKTKSSKK